MSETHNFFDFGIFTVIWEKMINIITRSVFSSMLGDKYVGI